MRTLILVKHAEPLVVVGQPAHSWRLSDAGRRSCAALAGRLRPYRPAALLSSREPKAAETARLAARELALPCEELDGLHEHDRTGVEWMGRQAFEAAVALFFRQPDDLVFGRETASQARARFASAVDAALARVPVGNVAIVAHGTVITLLACAHNPLDPFALWCRLGMPSLVAVRVPGFQVLDVVDSIETD